MTDDTQEQQNLPKATEAEKKEGISSIEIYAWSIRNDNDENWDDILWLFLTSPW